MPKISIVVPIYNVEKYLESCIESILNQTFTDFELILVNDGSTDNSPSICNRYKNMDERIRVYHKKNGGVSSARNLGIHVAKGKYISFIDPDDTIEPTMYEIMYREAVKTKSDIIISSYRIINLINESVESVELPFKKKRTMDKNEIRLELFPLLLSLKSGMGYGIYSSVNKLYKRSIFEDFEIKFDEEKNHGEDATLNILLLKKIETITFIPIPLYNYFVRKRDSLTQTFRENMFIDNLNNLENHLYLCHEFDCEQYIDGGIKNFLNLTIAHIIEISMSSLSFHNRKKLISNITNNLTFQQYLADYLCPNQFYIVLKYLANLKFDVLIIWAVKLLIIKQKFSNWRIGLYNENK